MILLDKEQLFYTFKVESFYTLSTIIDESAPSLVEYHLSNLDGEEVYLNKRDIENSLQFGNFSLYSDYSENIYLEKFKEEDDITGSFW